MKKDRYKSTLIDLLTSLGFLFFSINVFAQSNLEFVANKGQWDKSILFKAEIPTGAIAIKQDGSYQVMQIDTNDLKTIATAFHPSLQTNINALTKQKPELQSPNDFSTRFSGHVYQVRFLNSNQRPKIQGEKPTEQKNNYLIGDSSKWGVDCSVYNEILVQNIYRNIDIRYFSDKGNIKYDIIVRPGGDIQQVIMYVEGAEKVMVNQNKLSIKTSVSFSEQIIPSAYTFSLSRGKHEVACKFVQNGNVISFSLQKPLVKDETLIIDPQYVFSTFSGSSVANWGFTATYDLSGNFYSGGIVFGSGFKVTNGSFSTGFNGGNGATGEQATGFDIGLMKFNSTGSKVLYATYLGGKGNDYPHSMVVDPNNNLIVAGKTTSPDYPGYLSHFGPGQPNDNNFDITLTKLNVTGNALIGSILIGGNQNDGVNIKNKYPVQGNGGTITTRASYGDDSRSEVIIDSAGNVYVASCTQSEDFPIIGNVFQPTHGGRNSDGRFQDGVIIKATPDLNNIVFTSFIGGDGDDAPFVLAIDPISTNMAIAGGTQSRNFQGNFSGAAYPTFNGGITDGFVALISLDGSQMIKTTYIGTGANDIIYGVQFDKFGFPYIMGTTTGTFPVVNAQFVQPNAKQFIVKLNKELSGFIYSTTFGNPNSSFPNISPTAFLVDRCENVYVSGWGGRGNTIPGYQSGGTANLTITNGALKKKTDGSDFYFFVLERDAASQLYGSFFGEDDNNSTYPDHVDGGTSRFDKNGIIYQAVCANCSGGFFPTTAGSAYPNNGSRYCNQASIKIAFNLAGVGASLRSSIKSVTNKTTGCVPLKVDFSDVYRQGKQYEWNFGDGSPTVYTDTPRISHTYTKIGTYRAFVVSINQASCNGRDTSFIVIRARSDEAKLSISSKKFGDCKSVIYKFDNKTTAVRPFASNSFVLHYGDGLSDTISSPQTLFHTYPSNGTYLASLQLMDTNYCNAPDSLPIILRISDIVKAVINSDSIGCAPYTAILQNNSLAGETFEWDYGDNSPLESSNQLQVSHTYPDTGTYHLVLYAVDNSTCNKRDTGYFKLTVKSKPIGSFVFSPDPTRENEPVVFYNQTQLGDSYKWLFNDGDSLITNNVLKPIEHLYNATKIYRVNLIAYNRSGCTDTVEKDIPYITVPLVEVANAIAPFGVNNTVMVRGYGIEKLDWRIYNRWGKIVFQTNDKYAKWDGRSNGLVLASDVYLYTLQVQFTDGQSIKKTGDITLIR